MSAPKTSMVSTFVSYGTWSATTRSHPCTKWLEEYTKVFDARRLPEEASEWLDSTFTYAKADGTMHQNKAGVDQATKDYSFFTRYMHEPYYLACYETPDGTGYELSGNAWLFCDLHGEPSGPKVQDAHGDEWQMRVPSGFFFKFKKDTSAKHGGIRLISVSVTADGSPVMVELFKRGVIKPSDLGL